MFHVHLGSVEDLGHTRLKCVVWGGGGNMCVYVRLEVWLRGCAYVKRLSSYVQ